jgi:hypothetical protein
VHIDADHMHFFLNGDRLFVASINDDNSTFLDGNTQSHLESATLRGLKNYVHAKKTHINPHLMLLHIHLTVMSLIRQQKNIYL